MHSGWNNKIMKIIKKILAFLLVALFIVWVISLFSPKAKKVEYGLTFSYPYAQGLGLDWQKTYLAILDELKPKYIRLSAYWNSVEPEENGYDYKSLDFQINEASKRGVKIVLAAGRRLPRWPECHDPEWIKDLSPDVLESHQLSYLETVVNRYQGNQNIIAWQVENEPFLSLFGPCPKVDKAFFDTELALVKKLDPARPIVVTDSGELSTWMNAWPRADIFGTTLYRYVFNDVFKTYWTNHYPALFYRFKAGLMNILYPGKQVAIMELQAEPWTTKGIPNTPIDEQFKTMSMDNFNTILGIAKSTSFSPQYLWGAEWWYWMKEKGHPEFWEKAKELFKN
jgi:hypothetical protein